MAKSLEKIKALSLRKSGLSIGEIAKTLGVSKSTVSVWCRDITLSSFAIQQIAQKSKYKSTESLLRYSEIKRNQRQLSILQSEREGKQLLNKLSKRDIFCIGLGLYWGEGYKRGSQEFGFTNSDPNMTLFYLVWLKKIFNVDKDRLILRVSINESHADRIDTVVSYWLKLTGVQKSQFTKSSLIRTSSKKQYQNGNSHMGTLRVKVRAGTRLRRVILGSIGSISENI